MHLVIGLIVAVLTLRFLYRTWLNFPPYPGLSPLQGTDVEGLMEEGRFWSLIHESRRRGGGDYEAQLDELTGLLEGERLADIVAFERAFTALLNRANHFRYWECAYALNWGCSDDTFHYFCTWWIGQGKNKFYWSMRFPRLLFFFAVREFMQPYEGLGYCAGQAYENLAGRAMPVEDIEYFDTRGHLFNENLAIIKHPGLAFLAW
ncbi:MAG: DUF4240 domain-containing protein [Gammaproteobacteria bacterium]|nr:DUF4240 domain-containing protein [Gammaproteobacteria bacterium]